MRKRMLLMDGYLFEKEGKCETVNLPHTWNGADGQGGARSYYRGCCSYTKSFRCPEKNPGDRVYLEFRGVNASAVVLVNGEQLAKHEGGYSIFRADITEALREENELKVLVDNGPGDSVYPQQADFTFYGGIYRAVYLLVVPEMHFDLDYFGGSGLKITPQVSGKAAEILFEAFGSREAERVTVQVSGVGEIELKPEEQGYRGTMTIPDVHLWNGLRDPFLYHAKAQLWKDGVPVDEVEEDFGCRTCFFDPEKGFFLNGNSYPLHGVSRHQDRPDVGNALTPEMHEEDMELILSMGANSIRLAHYQHDPYFYELCDQKGVLVWAEIPYITVHMPKGRENTISQMKELIVQNYNHPSIFCWAISNEISLQGVTEDLLENHRILNDMIHEMDPGRVSAMANLFLLETDSPLVALPDIRGYNLYYGWYVGEMEDNDAFFDRFHEEHPDMAIGLTEYGADSVIRLQSPKPVKGDYTESYQAVYHEHMLEMIAKRPYLWGTYVWNMFEFAAAGREDAGDPGKNHKGLITFDRKIKKDAYYIYKAWWSKEPFVHLCCKRYANRIEPVTEIKVYSNQKKVVLLVDGERFGEKEGEHIFRFMVPISGVHQIRAVSEGKGDSAEAEGGSLMWQDEIEIRKVSEPDPSYFMDAARVRNWFEEPREEAAAEMEGFLSLNSTMAEIQATSRGAALLGQLMEQMKHGMAGGMGKNAEIPRGMMEMIARQPLKKLLVQAGIETDSEQGKQLAAALSQIPKGDC